MWNWDKKCTSVPSPSLKRSYNRSRTTENGDNYCTAPKSNMGRSARGNLIWWVNLQNRRRAGSSYGHYYLCPLLRGAAVGLALTILSNDVLCARFSSFLNSPVFQATSMWFCSSMRPSENWTRSDDGATRAKVPGPQQGSCGSVQRGRGGDRCSQRRS